MFSRGDEETWMRRRRNLVKRKKKLVCEEDNFCREGVRPEGTE